jgi:predicted NBD/HSP70 family sugar kinase
LHLADHADTMYRWSGSNQGLDQLEHVIVQREVPVVGSVVGGSRPWFYEHLPQPRHADLSCQVLAEARVGLPDRQRAGEDLEHMATLLDTVLGQVGAQRAELLGIGLGCRRRSIPGPGGSAHRRSCPAASAWTRRRWPGTGFGAAVSVDNDANLGALAEASWGAGRGGANSVYLKLSDGVGAGLMLNGQLYRARRGTTGEIGHTTMQEYGALYRCGNRGCLERWPRRRQR